MDQVPGLFVAPSEPLMLKGLGTVSLSMTEKYGVDVCWGTKAGLVGVQRKALPDFIASMHDGRLAKEIAQMKGGLERTMVLVEGFGTWTSDGVLMSSFAKTNRHQVRAFLWSIREQGIWVEWTENLHDTCNTIRWLASWTRKDQHTSLHGRPKPRGNWGKASDRDYQIHLLTSVPGVGSGTAERIIDHFGGVPMRWTVNVEELMEVEGVGKVRAEKMMRALDNGEPV